MKRTRLHRKTGLKPVNRRRLARRRAVEFGAQAEMCRTMACCLCGRRPADPHHDPTRAAGGLDADTAPVCRICHSDARLLAEKSTFLRAVADRLRPSPPSPPP